jgi:hypothetical protein
LPLLLPQNKKPFTALALRSAAVPFLPCLLFLAAIANLSLRSAGGDDCLGYTVIAEKRCTALVGNHDA